MRLPVTGSCPQCNWPVSLIRASDPATIRSVTVVGGRRLTGPEMLRLREEAAASGVLLSMDNTGDVRLRRGNT